jgi:hypothetical protein
MRISVYRFKHVNITYLDGCDLLEFEHGKGRHVDAYDVDHRQQEAPTRQEDVLVVLSFGW